MEFAIIESPHPISYSFACEANIAYYGLNVKTLKLIRMTKIVVLSFCVHCSMHYAILSFLVVVDNVLFVKIYDNNLGAFY